MNRQVLVACGGAWLPPTRKKVTKAVIIIIVWVKFIAAWVLIARVDQERRDWNKFEMHDFESLVRLR